MSEADPFGLDDSDETGGGGGTGADSANMKALRDFAKKRDAEAKALEARIAEFEKAAAEAAEKAREVQIVDTFKAVGLKDKHSELFKAKYPEGEVTEDAVRKFAAEYELATIEGAVVEAPAPAESKPEGFTPVTTGSAPSSKVYSLEEAQAMINEGRYDEAQKLYKEGKVEALPRDAEGMPAINWLEGIRD